LLPLNPERIFENSPRFQNWEKAREVLSPEGMADNLRGGEDSIVASGLEGLLGSLPSLERLGYFQPSPPEV
jgi:hypothetical protein